MAAPNIVVIMTDDQPDKRVLQTMPKLAEQIAARGMRFVNSFVNNPVCSPSRTSFFTGLAWHNQPHSEDQSGYEKFRTLEDNTLPVWLQAAGYRTALIGKFMNGYETKTLSGQTTHIPPGWDEWRAWNGGAQYYDYSLNENGTTIGYPMAVANYKTDVLARKAVDFIRRQDARPFFLYVATNAPHGSREERAIPGGLGYNAAVPAERHRGTFRDLKVPLTPDINEADMSDKPSFMRDLPLMDLARIKAQYRAIKETELAIDDLIGAVVDALAAAGKLDDTVIIYTSDNGIVNGHHRLGGKEVPYDPATRVPLYIRGPGIRPGIRSHALVFNLDLPATILDLAGAPAGRPQDGMSLVPLFANPRLPWRSEIRMDGGDDPRWTAVRSADRLSVQYDNGERELYDLTVDPHMLDNLSSARSAR